MSRHPINGPFSELFLCLVPLVGLTRAHVVSRGRAGDQRSSSLSGWVKIAAPPDAVRSEGRPTELEIDEPHQRHPEGEYRSGPERE